MVNVYKVVKMNKVAKQTLFYKICGGGYTKYQSSVKNNTNQIQTNVNGSRGGGALRRDAAA